ncbi:MAG: MerR family transcriptional regulator [Hyphomicrobiaceae bacterium]
MAKAERIFLTIGHVAEELDIPKHVLRFWEAKFPRLRPLKRGGERRYYRPQDMDLLRGIRILLREDGYTIKGVQRILRERGAAYVKSCGVAQAAAQPARPRRSLSQDFTRILAELQACRAILDADLPADTRR